MNPPQGIPAPPLQLTILAHSSTQIYKSPNFAECNPLKSLSVRTLCSLTPTHCASARHTPPRSQMRREPLAHPFHAPTTGTLQEPQHPTPLPTPLHSPAHAPQTHTLCMNPPLHPPDCINPCHPHHTHCRSPPSVTHTLRETPSTSPFSIHIYPPQWEPPLVAWTDTGTPSDSPLSTG